MKNFGANLAYRPSVRGPENNSARPGVVSRIVAYSYVVAIGSGAAYYYSYSEAFPVAGYTILFGGLWFAVWALFSTRGRAVLGVLLKADILLWFILVAMPLALQGGSADHGSRGVDPSRVEPGHHNSPVS